MDIPDVRNLRVKQLKAELKKRGLNTKGLKETLAKRLQSEVDREKENDKRNQSIVVDDNPTSPVILFENVNHKKLDKETNTPATDISDLYDLFSNVLAILNDLSSRVSKLELQAKSSSEARPPSHDNEQPGTFFTVPTQNQATSISEVRAPSHDNEQPGTCFSVPTQNRFNVLADMADDPEDVCGPPPTVLSTGDQLKEYRDRQNIRYLSEGIKHRDANTTPAMSTRCQMNEMPDVIIAGDSIIKHIDGRRMSRKRKVVCLPNPGATVADIPSKVIEGVKAKGDVVLHVGSNELSTSGPNGSTADDIIALADEISASGREVCLSSVVHRRWETVHQRRLVDGVNEGLKRAARERRWGYIDNGNIVDRHLGRDGVHLNKAGQAVLSSNLRRFIERPRWQPVAPPQLRSYAEVVGSASPQQNFIGIPRRGNSNIVDMHLGRDWVHQLKEVPAEHDQRRRRSQMSVRRIGDGQNGRRMSRASSDEERSEGLDFSTTSNKVRMKPTRQEWQEYLQFVRMALNG